MTPNGIASGYQSDDLSTSLAGLEWRELAFRRFAAIAPKGLLMFAIPRRYSHFVFGVIQSGLTSLIAAGIASLSAVANGRFLWNWLPSWLLSRIAIAPVVLPAAPAIGRCRSS
jgi:hypothetical protein